MEFDVVVIGGGLAGLVTATHAAELGLRPAVLEKGTGDQYICNSRYSSGALHVAFRDMKTDPAELRARIEEVSGGFARPDLVEAVVADSSRAVDWLRENGARFVKAGPFVWQRWVLAPPGMNRTGLHWQGRGADVLLRALVANLQRRGGQLFLETQVRAIVMEGQRAAGVDATTAGQPVRYLAPAVVVADGGFQGNPEMVRRYISPRPDRLKQRGAGTGTGDGLRMAEAVGAQLVGLEWFYGHLLSRDALVNDQLWPYPFLDYTSAAGILVDAAGQRFTDEGRGGISMANAVARLEDPLSATAIFDEAIWNGPGHDMIVPPNPNLTLAGGTLHKAPDLATLAAAIGVPAVSLEKTVAAYNQAHARGELDVLTPARSTNQYQAYPIRQAPFYAVPLCAGITFTMGGIATDGNARVLRGDGTAIPGLFAVGATTGGLEGGPLAGYIGGLAKGTIFGLRAAEQIARERH